MSLNLVVRQQELEAAQGAALEVLRDLLHGIGRAAAEIPTDPAHLRPLLHAVLAGVEVLRGTVGDMQARHEVITGLSEGIARVQLTSATDGQRH